ncbi:MAG TPA: hypothetical protein VE091_02330, partial [Gemmatimonadales bacterium]|nr:hypothetical protein [Gemmatimonadales bacterium]
LGMLLQNTAELKQIKATAAGAKEQTALPPGVENGQAELWEPYVLLHRYRLRRTTWELLPPALRLQLRRSHQGWINGRWLALVALCHSSVALFLSLVPEFPKVVAVASTATLVIGAFAFAVATFDTPFGTKASSTPGEPVNDWWEALDPVLEMRQNGTHSLFASVPVNSPYTVVALVCYLLSLSIAAAASPAFPFSHWF